MLESEEKKAREGIIKIYEDLKLQMQVIEI